MRLSTKLMVAMTGLTVLTAAIVGLLVYFNLARAMLAGESRIAQSEARRLVATLEESVGDLEADLRKLIAAPALAGFIGERQGTSGPPEIRLSESEWKALIAGLFTATLEAEPNYIQMRLIGRSGDGREVIRVDRPGAGEPVRVVGEEQLQAKGDRPYFQEAIGLRRGEIHISPIELNREHGAIQRPPVPVLRAAAPVYGSDGEPYGIVVINLDVRPVFAALRNRAAEDSSLYLINHAGGYLLHPDSSRAFEFELDDRYVPEADPLVELATASQVGGAIVEELRYPDGGTFHAVVESTRLGGGPEVSLVRTMPRSVILQPLVAIRNVTLAVGFIVVLVAIFLAALISRSVARPIERLIVALSRFSGEDPIQMDFAAGGEIGHLAGKFAEMMRTVARNTAQLRNEIGLRERAQGEASRSQEQEQLLGALVDSANDAIFTTSLDGIVQSWNPAADRLYGYPIKEAVGEHFTRIVPPDRREEMLRHLDRVRQRESVKIPETVLVTKGGRPLDISLNISPVVDRAGEAVAASFISRDISDRKLAEETFRLAIESSPSGMLIVGADGRIRMDNSEARRMFGYEPGELLGCVVEDLLPQGYRPDHPRLRLKYLGNPSVRKMGAGRELFGLRKDGTEFPLEIGLNPISTRGGILVLAVIIDISEHQSLLNQLRQAQKMEAIGRLAGGVAHDFNNLLTVINGYSELLLLEETITGNARELLEEIHRSGERASAVTKQLLALGRKSVIKPRPSSLNEVVVEMEKLLRRLIGEDIELSMVLDPNLGFVLIDTTQIEQVLMNLAVNARDAMPDGGQLAIRTQRVELREPGPTKEPDLVPGEYVMLSISDTGVGISEDIRHHIFEPFYTTKKAGEGTGLGLATVYGIVKQSGGQITVYSEPGIGTTFKMYLPRLEDSHLPLPREMVTVVDLSGDETVLLAEDESGLRAFAKLVLESHGYRVLAASSGPEAIECSNAEPGQIHVLLTDVVMPQMNGRELADQLQLLRPGIRVLFMSGYTDDAVLRRGILRTEKAFLEKPFTPTRLLRAVREVLDNGTNA